MATIYDYINRFWAEAERCPFNPTEVALYHYLLHEANRQRWEMPFPCHTAIISVRLSTTKQNICKARQRLSERGLITCQGGTGPHAPARYALTEPVPRQMGRQLSQPLTRQLTHSNIEDKDKDIIYTHPARGDGYKSLDELEALLLADAAWQENIVDQLAKRETRTVDTDQLYGYIRAFFDEQRIGGNGARNESDCRRHFYHWIIKHLNATRHGTTRKSAAYRDTDVTAASAEEYEGAF